jgi:hypothetical protein
MIGEPWMRGSPFCFNSSLLRQATTSLPQQVLLHFAHHFSLCERKMMGK